MIIIASQQFTSVQEEGCDFNRLTQWLISSNEGPIVTIQYKSSISTVDQFGISFGSTKQAVKYGHNLFV